MFFYSNGCRFEGYFKGNQKEGFGITVDSFGREKIDLYKNDRLIALEHKKINEGNLSKKKKEKDGEKPLPKLTRKAKNYDSRRPSDN